MINRHSGRTTVFHVFLGDDVTTESFLLCSPEPEPKHKHKKTHHEGSVPLGATQRQAVLQKTKPARLQSFAAPASKADKLPQKRKPVGLAQRSSVETIGIGSKMGQAKSPNRPPESKNKLQADSRIARNTGQRKGVSPGMFFVSPCFSIFYE
jgi:hypothetical protein